MPTGTGAEAVRRQAIEARQGIFPATAARRAWRRAPHHVVRQRQSAARGGGPSFDEPQLSRLNVLLDELGAIEPSLTEIVELRFFCGFTVPEIATMRGVSVHTVQRPRERARLYLPARTTFPMGGGTHIERDDQRRRDLSGMDR